MKYELAKQLKDAGFPQNLQPGKWVDTDPTTVSVCVPTLSELIDACGDKFSLLSRAGMDKYHAAAARDTTIVQEGSSPEEAVAKLWLALHSTN